MRKSKSHKKMNDTDDDDICAVCDLHVKNEDGVKCQGPCEKWRHFACLDISACKLRAVKSGILELKCPCPNCDESESRELWNESPCCENVTSCPTPRGNSSELAGSKSEAIPNNADYLKQSLAELESGVDDLKTKQASIEMLFQSMKEISTLVDQITRKMDEVKDKAKEVIEGLEKERRNKSSAPMTRKSSSPSRGKSCFCPSNPAPDSNESFF